MELPVLTPEEFLFAMALVGMVMLLCVFVPVQLAAKWRRIRSERTRLTCRICGYRFLRPGQEAPCRCPHCGAHNA